MSTDASILLFFGDAEYCFKLGIGQFRELQDRVNGRRLAMGAPVVGPMSILKALQANDAWPDDVRDILRIALNGGGMKPQDTQRLLALYFDGEPPLIHMKTAHAVLLAGLVGSPTEQIDAKKKPETPTTDRSSSPPSTAPVLQ
jgi:hypothetical protein